MKDTVESVSKNNFMTMFTEGLKAAGLKDILSDTNALTSLNPAKTLPGIYTTNVEAGWEGTSRKVELKMVFNDHISIGLCRISPVVEQNISIVPESKGMDTIATVLERLRRKNQDNEFAVNKYGLITMSGKVYDQHEVKIIHTYRFEGASDPSEQAIIYLVEANDGTIGYSLDAYGVYTNHNNDGYADMIHNMALAGR